MDRADPGFGARYEVNFVSDAAGTRYSVNGGPEIPYDDSAVIQVGGIRVELNGIPDDGDAFVFDEAANLDSDLFRALEDVIEALQTPTDLPPGEALVHNRLNTALRKLDNNLENVLVTRASIGARLNEMDSIDAISGGRNSRWRNSVLI